MNPVRRFIQSHTSQTKGILIALIGWAGISQIPPIQHHLIRPWLDAHPRLAPIVWTLTAIGFLLLMPRVQQRVKDRWNVDLCESKDAIGSVVEDLRAAGKRATEALGHKPKTDDPSKQQHTQRP
jgi:hypothetical protein